MINTPGHKKCESGIKAGFKKDPDLSAISDKVCNLDYLIGATKGNTKIINNIVAVFFKETGIELLLLDDAVKKRNYKIITDISHKLKSAFPILGISILEAVFKEIEHLCSITSPIGKIDQLSCRVNFVFNQAMAELNMMQNV